MTLRINRLLIEKLSLLSQCSLGLSSFVSTRQSLIIGSSSHLAAEVCSSELETNTRADSQPRLESAARVQATTRSYHYSH